MVNQMTAIELDFLAVGKETKSGDAIAIRYGTPDAWEVMVVDGGDLAAGADLVAHINAHYGSPARLAHVVCTHSDGDHVSGLRKVLEAFEVENLWVHQPWLYASELNPYFKGNWSDANLAQHLRNDCFSIVAELCDMAEQYGVALREPFAGAQIGPFTVLAPTHDRLLALYPQMDQTPVQKMLSETAKLMRKAKQAVLSIFETWEHETLQDPGPNGTSIPNQTSVVMYAPMEGGILLTGDAGTAALEEAASVAEVLNMPLQRPHFVQIPHHGSRHNVSPAVLDRILGPRFPTKVDPVGYAYTSAAAKSDMPRRVVENAFTRRGYGCWDTKAGQRTWKRGFPNRPGWTYGGSPKELHQWVED
jgi:beta-lactamase superfamily II metal-dependent hydrolase